jgi:nicotinamide riboside kinase
MKKNKIVLLGPESTGKTTLCKSLAQYFNDLWLPELGRIYLENLKRKYTYEDVVLIAQRQVWREKEYLQKAKKFLFVDTDLINIKVWFEVVFGKYPRWLEKEIISNKAGFYLLTYPDLEWKYDPFRENPGKMRFFLYEKYLENLYYYNTNFKIIRVKGQTREKRTIEAVCDFAGIKCEFKP